MSGPQFLDPGEQPPRGTAGISHVAAEYRPELVDEVAFDAMAVVLDAARRAGLPEVSQMRFDLPAERATVDSMIADGIATPDLAGWLADHPECVVILTTAL